MSQSIIKDPVTGQQFSRDTAVPGSIYAAYTPTADQPAAGAASSAPSSPVVSPIQRTIDPGADAATKYLDTFHAPETSDQIAERLRQGSQGAIDAINKTFDDQVAASQKTGQERLAADNAISVLSGLTGSTEAGRTRGAVSAANDKEVAAINNQRLLQLSGLYSQISKQAEDEALQQREDATKNAQDVLARRKDAQAQTLDTLKAIAAGGLVDFDSFKSSPQNAAVYQHALDAVGGSEQALRGLFAVNRPADQLVGSPTRVGDHFIQAYQNPVTGKVSYDKVEVPGGLPPQYNNFQKIGDSLVAIPDGWDGDTNTLKVIAGGSGGGAGGYDGDFAATVDLASNANKNAPNVTKQAIRSQLQSYIAAGDYKSAYQGIVQQTRAGLDTTNATRFDNALGLDSTLGDLKDALQAFSDAGGNTNILTGTQDQIQTKLGVLMTDPKYASLAVQLDTAYQNYRLMLTGANFSSAEASAYASVLPQKGNTFALNQAKIEGARAAANSTVEGGIKSVVGDGGIYLKQYAEGAAPAAAGSADSDPLGLGI
jgi:hypothetical protein